jgi:hypothetical protein
VVSSAMIAIGRAQCGHWRSAAGCVPVAAAVAGRVWMRPRGSTAGRFGLVRRRQASVLQAGLQVARLRMVGIGVWQIGQGRVCSGMGGHRRTECGGVGLVGA